ncbi:LysR family transcriptional regulator [Sandaracinobacter sp. RS1-74]|uniref:LysR family transcriptional regulator n=1 Tax=Sandaracinobacteroides sayramensis TaxID=2913411 RepID=UPI001EDC389E|nr:LysR family transcriptional regulator [Sandaracinobacteroides sayramensis]MCG2842596.1 LysR family transcriptional regulator [Sandaracinobacteroides sayramensis]
MLDDLNELKTFRAIIEQRSLTGAATVVGASLAVVSKRLASLEQRIGLRLVHRTTRRLSPTDDGLVLLESVVRALDAIEEGEERISRGRVEPVGLLRVTAPVSFGRSHVTPLLGTLAQEHPRLKIAVRLTDVVVDLVAGGYDVAIRIGGLADSSCMMRKLVGNRRILVASPAYLDRRGRPETIEDLEGHDLLGYGNAVFPWSLTHRSGATATVPASFRLASDNGDVVRDWSVAGLGIMMKSEIDVADDLKAGVLDRTMPDWHGGDAPIVALYPSARHLPLKTSILLDALADILSVSGTSSTRSQVY